MKLKALLFLASSIFLLSFTSTKKSKKYTPPGTVAIYENTFMDETEISNISWQEYMYWTKKIYGENSTPYLATKPDSTVWDEPLVNVYISHPAYNNYPVVGVTWQQAKEYCKWRSERVMEQLLINKAQKPKTVIPTKITYRLPTQKEWETIAKAGNLEKTQNKIDKKYSRASTANYKLDKPGLTPSTTAPVYSYWPNEFGVYNILGNVAEMTSEEGIAKGGSWAQLENEVSVEKVFQYKEPQNWVGFRCICVIEYSDM